MKLSNETKKIIKNFFIATAIMAVFALLLFGMLMLLFAGSNDPEAKKIGYGVAFGMFGVGVFINLCVAISAMPLKKAGKRLEKAGEEKANKEYKKERITEIDKTKYEGYYRDILSLDSPIVISFIDDFEISPTDLIAELFKLKMKGIIEITENGITIFKENAEIENEIDKYAVQCIKQHGKLIANRALLEHKLSEQACKLELLEEISVDSENIKNKIEKKDKIIKAILYIFIFAVFTFLSTVLKDSGLVEILSTVIIGVVIFLVFSYNESYKERYESISWDMPYIRTKKGEELNKKIEGLKNFTKDYTLLDERTLEEIVLWEDYLVYSVLWGQNENEIKKYEQYVGFEEVK